MQASHHEEAERSQDSSTAEDESGTCGNAGGDAGGGAGGGAARVAVVHQPLLHVVLVVLQSEIRANCAAGECLRG